MVAFLKGSLRIFRKKGRFENNLKFIRAFDLQRVGVGSPMIESPIEVILC